MSDSKPGQLAHLRAGLDDVNGDGVPDWAIAGKGKPDEPDLDDPFVLTPDEVAVRGDDHEIAHRSGDEVGDYVDAAPHRRTVLEKVIASATETRNPIIPRALRTREGRRALWVAIKRLTRYYAGYWAWNGPGWVIYRAWWLVRGLVLTLRRYLYWLRDGEFWADLKDVDAAEKRVNLRKGHKGEFWLRLRDSGFAVVATLAAALTCLLLPEDPFQPWARLVLFAVAPAAAGVWLMAVGKPPEKTWAGERVFKRGGWSRLTAESVREGLAKPRLVKDVADVRFAAPVRMLAHGDLAFVQLPQGVTARDIMAKRDKLASGLGVMLNQCFPFEATKKHLTGWPVDVSTMGLLVTHKPMSEMDLSEFPRWPGLALVAKRGRGDYFTGFPLMHDVLFNPVKFYFEELNTVVAGRMGVGKSAWLQIILMYAALDPTVQLIVCEFKGVADFLLGSALYSDYVEGLEDEDFARVVEILEWLEQELKRRGARIKAARKAGRAPKGKVTRQLADDPNGGLHPILMIIDEFHMLSLHKKYGERAMFLLEQIIKRGRALGVHIILATQIPNAKSVPSDIMTSIGTAICGGVRGWRANNMVLGEGAFEAGWRATDLMPGNEEERGDAGFAYFKSIFDPVLTHAYYPTPAEQKKVYDYAHVHLRGERVVGQPADPEEIEPPRDVLYDIQVTITDLGVDKAQWTKLAAELAARWPASWAHVKTGPQLSAIARKASVLRDGKGAPILDDEGKEVQLVRSVTVKGGPGKPQGEETSVNGCHLAEVVAAREVLAAHALPGQRQAQAIEGPDEGNDDEDFGDDDVAGGNAAPQGPPRKGNPRPATRGGNAVALAQPRSVAWDDDDLAPGNEGNDRDDEDDDFDDDEPPAVPGAERDEVEPVRAPRLQQEEDNGLTPLQEAAELVLRAQYASAVMLKRKMQIPEVDAVLLLDRLAELGIVDEGDPRNVRKAREVLLPISELDDVVIRLRGAE